MSSAASTVPGKAPRYNRQGRRSKDRKDLSAPEIRKGGNSGAYRFGDIFGYKPIGYLSGNKPAHLTPIGQARSSPTAKQKKPGSTSNNTNIVTEGQNSDGDSYQLATFVNTNKDNINVRKEKELNEPKRKGVKYKAPMMATEIVDNAYRGRVKTLETENKELLGSFDSLYKENKLLREKLQSVTGKDIHIEPYRQLVTDREVLREAEATYRNRISRLEKDNKGAVHTFLSVNEENKYLRRRLEKLEEREHMAYENRKKVKDLTTSIAKLEGEIEKIGTQKNQLEIEVLKMKELLAERDATIRVILGRSEF